MSNETNLDICQHNLSSLAGGNTTTGTPHSVKKGGKTPNSEVKSPKSGGLGCKSRKSKRKRLEPKWKRDYVNIRGGEQEKRQAKASLFLPLEYSVALLVSAARLSTPIVVRNNITRQSTMADDIFAVC
ncbi:hypothetical protein ACSQ67_017905 [Phaseolus vulgaris]